MMNLDEIEKMYKDARLELLRAMVRLAKEEMAVSKAKRDMSSASALLVNAQRDAATPVTTSNLPEE